MPVKLLKLLRQYGHTDLPKKYENSYQSFSAYFYIRKIVEKYIYFGLSNGIRGVFQENKHTSVPDEISLMVNVDGVLLFKPSADQTWPKLCKFGTFTVFVVTLFHSKTKPTNANEFEMKKVS